MFTHSQPKPTFVMRGEWKRAALQATLVIGSLCAVFALDRATGSAPAQHLYYIPIILAGLWFMRWGSVTAAAAAIVLYHIANPHLQSFHYNELDLLQIALFVAVGLVTSRLVQDAQRMRALASTDDLTGLHNLRSFEAHLASIVNTARATATPVSLIVIDVDRLKSLNDRYGHLAGSEAVREVGRIIAETVPHDAVACRYGGDEFVIALPRRDESQAKQIAGSLRHHVHAVAPTLAGIAFPAGTLSVSVGVASRMLFRGVRRSPDGDVEGGEALFRSADSALYVAKNCGRNAVSVA
jgi:diguanylate cyclase (GGDEF)-like protein